MNILMYHYVRHFDANLPRLHHKKFDEFKQEISFLQKHELLASRDDLTSMLDSPITKPNDKQKYVLSFDDGLWCHYHNVFQYLKSIGAWGFFFFCTDPLMKGKPLLVHKVHYLIASQSIHVIWKHLDDWLSKLALDDKWDSRIADLTYQNQKGSDLEKHIKRLLNYILEPADASDLLDELYDKFKITFPKDYYCDLSQLQEMESNGMVIGPHSCSHHPLSQLNASAQEAEISKSIEYCEANLTYSWRTFCFPYGGHHNFDDTSLQLLEKHNIDLCFSVEQRSLYGYVKTTRDKLHLPRFDCNVLPQHIIGMQGLGN